MIVNRSGTNCIGPRRVALIISVLMVPGFVFDHGEVRKVPCD